MKSFALLGQGGMGAVYQARIVSWTPSRLESDSRDMVASPEILKRFKQELSWPARLPQITFKATWRSSSRSRAWYTAPMPPCPSKRMIS